MANLLRQLLEKIKIRLLRTNSTNLKVCFLSSFDLHDTQHFKRNICCKIAIFNVFCLLHFIETDNKPRFAIGCFRYFVYYLNIYFYRCAKPDSELLINHSFLVFR